jgi:NADH:ubiquinone oxidoreductase subunit 5 (subunit L)/multisubunit Na+/H+ antiporter MnhA subunit
MVTAGVFLLIRVSAWLDISQSALYIIMIFGALTAIFAGSVGITQYDIKRVIAYSTCSQLGYMVLVCGCTLFSIGLFHLFNHAFFKALLFLGSGSIIHAMGDEQDMRKYGLLSWFTPFVGQAFLLASIALMGLPFLSGFYSKDSILEVLISTHSEFSLWGYWVGLGAALLTTIYSFKIVYWTFYSSTFTGFRKVVESWHNPSRVELGVLSFLIFLAVFSGYTFKDQFLGLGSNYFQISLKDLGSLNDAEFLPSHIKLIPLEYTIIVLGFAYLLSSEKHLDFINLYISNITVYNSFNFLSHKWYFNLLQNTFVSQKLLNAGYETFWIWDRWLLEQINAN